MFSRHSKSHLALGLALNSLIIYFLLAVVEHDNQVSAIACYTFQNGSQNMTIVEGCAECKKVFMWFNSSGEIEITERWQCENSLTVSQCPNQEIVAASYYGDGSSETRLCTCCSDFCNGDPDFCTANNSLVMRIKSMIPLIYANEKPRDWSNKAPLACYNDIENSTKQILLSGCKECRKQSFTGSLFNEHHQWQCITSHSDDIIKTASKKACTPFVSATLSTDDGVTSMQAFCTCCSDACNDADFCKLPPPIRSSKSQFPYANFQHYAARSKSAHHFDARHPTRLISSSTGVQITLSSLLLFVLILTAGQRVYAMLPHGEKS